MGLCVLVVTLLVTVAAALGSHATRARGSRPADGYGERVDDTIPFSVQDAPHAPLTRPG